MGSAHYITFVGRWGCQTARFDVMILAQTLEVLPRALRYASSKHELLSKFCGTPSVAFVQKLRTIPNDRAVFRKDEPITEQGIKPQPAGFFDGGFVVGVTVTTQYTDGAGLVGLLQDRAVDINEDHWTEIRTLLREACDLLAGELNGL